MSISDEEFQRFQNQLVDLKTRNYQLEEQQRKSVAGSTEIFDFLLSENCSFSEIRDLKSQLETNKKDGINLSLPTTVRRSIQKK